jgi:hypothetical protein
MPVLIAVTNVMPLTLTFGKRDEVFGVGVVELGIAMDFPCDLADTLDGALFGSLLEGGLFARPVVINDFPCSLTHASSRTQGSNRSYHKVSIGIGRFPRKSPGSIRAIRREILDRVAGREVVKPVKTFTTERVFDHRSSLKRVEGEGVERNQDGVLCN